MSPGALLLAAGLAAAGTGASEPLRGFNTLGEKPFGALLLGEGGDRDWKATVDEIKKRVGKKFPFEFAPGMADSRSIQRGLDALTAARVKVIVIVPLFVSSYGEVMDQNRFLLGIRETPSKELMEAPHSHRGSTAPARVRSRVPVVLTKALDDHPIIVELLASRALSLSRKPAEEALLLVGAAPSAPDEQQEWASAAASLAEKVRQKGGFAAARAFPLRSGPAQKDREISESALRAAAKDLRRAHKVIIVPLALTASGGRLRLSRAIDGLFAKYDGRTILPDPRLALWVEQSAETAAKLPDMRLYKDAARPAGLTPAPALPRLGGKHE